MKILFILNCYDEFSSPVEYHTVNYLIQSFEGLSHTFTIISKNFPLNLAFGRTVHLKYDDQSSDIDFLQFFSEIDIGSFNKVIISEDLQNLIGVLYLFWLSQKNSMSRISLICHQNESAEMLKFIGETSMKPTIYSSLPREKDSFSGLNYVQLPIIENLGISRSIENNNLSKYQHFSFLINENSPQDIYESVELAANLKSHSWRLKSVFESERILFKFEILCTSEENFSASKEWADQNLRNFGISDISEVKLFSAPNANSVNTELSQIRIFFSEQPIAIFLCAFRTQQKMISFFPKDSRFQMLFDPDTLSKFSFIDPSWITAEKISEHSLSSMGGLKFSSDYAKNSNGFPILKNKSLKNRKTKTSKVHLLILPRLNGVNSLNRETPQKDFAIDHIKNWKYGSIFVSNETVLASKFKSADIDVKVVDLSNKIDSLCSDKDNIFVLREEYLLKKSKAFDQFFANLCELPNLIFLFGIQNGTSMDYFSTNEKDSIENYVGALNHPFMANAKVCLKLLQFLNGKLLLGKELLSTSIVTLPIGLPIKNKVSSASIKFQRNQIRANFLNQVSHELNWNKRQIEFLYHSLAD